MKEDIPTPSSPPADRLTYYRSKLAAAGLTEEEIKRLLDPIEGFFLEEPVYDPHQT